MPDETPPSQPASTPEKSKSKHILYLALAITGAAAVIGLILYFLGEAGGTPPTCTPCNGGCSDSSECCSDCPDCIAGVCQSSSGELDLSASPGSGLSINVSITGGTPNEGAYLWVCASETISTSCTQYQEQFDSFGDWEAGITVSSAGTYYLIAQDQISGNYSNWAEVTITSTTGTISVQVGGSDSGPWGNSYTLPAGDVVVYFNATNDPNNFYLLFNNTANTGGCSQFNGTGYCNWCVDNDTCGWDYLAANETIWGEGGFPQGTWYLALYDPTTDTTSNWVELIVQESE